MQTKIEFFSSIPLLNKESRRNISTLIYHFSPITVMKNQIIFKEGDISDSIYIIKRGEIKMLKKFDYPKDENDYEVDEENIKINSQSVKKKNFEVKLI